MKRNDPNKNQVLDHSRFPNEYHTRLNCWRLKKPKTSENAGKGSFEMQNLACNNLECDELKAARLALHVINWKV